MTVIYYHDSKWSISKGHEMNATHEVVDFGPGPKDSIVGYPFCGTEEECGRWIEAHQVSGVRDGRYGVQQIPNDGSDR